MSERRRILNIAKQVSPEISRKYFIVETYLTVDGHRSRLASGRFLTQAAAQDYLDSIDS